MEDVSFLLYREDVEDMRYIPKENYALTMAISFNYEDKSCLAPSLCDLRVIRHFLGYFDASCLRHTLDSVFFGNEKIRESYIIS